MKGEKEEERNKGALPSPSFHTDYSLAFDAKEEEKETKTW